MITDLEAAFAAHPVEPAPHAAAMPRSAILAIAASVRAIRNRPVADFTVGDFDPRAFPAPRALVQGVADALAEGHTAYPPAQGMPELRSAIVAAAERDFGVRWPVASAVVGSGARPPIYAAFQTLVSPGDTVVYSVPCWNIPYYVHLRDAVGIPVVTRPEAGFLPSAADLAPHLPAARLLVINSPSNPVGTLLSPDVLREICALVVAENDRRRRHGRPALLFLYDQVYWQLVYDGAVHAVPAALNPDVAPYTLHVDAISKSMAATGMRVGWVLAPPALAEALTTWIGHMGAWAGRAEQIATARLLLEPDRTADHLAALRGGLQTRLRQLGDGLLALRAHGLDVSIVPPTAGLYLAARFPGRGNDETVRRWLLDAAGIAVVPMSAFGMADSGWVRFSVGAVTPEAIEAALDRLRLAVS